MSTPHSHSPVPQRYSILVVDDHPMTRYGIVRLLDQEPDLAVCAEAQDAAGAFSALKIHKPHLVLTDLTLPNVDGLEFIKDLRAMFPKLLILVLSMHNEEIYAERVLRAGARGYMMKSAGGEQLVDAIHQVLAGKTYLSKKMAEKATEFFSGHKDRSGNLGLGKLTDREFEVFGLLGKGLTNREIGRRLNISVKTVETHRLHVREKLQMKTGAALMQHAVEWATMQKST